MSRPANSTGLGIDFQTSEVPHPAVPIGSGYASCGPRERLRRTLTGPRAPPLSQLLDSQSGFQSRSGSVAMTRSQPGSFRASRMRSIGGMQGLEGAASGDTMVTFGVNGGVMREGSRIILDSPGGYSVVPRPLQRRHSTGDRSNKLASSPNMMPRDVTLMSFGPSHAGGGDDFKSLLGDSNARLKSGAVILPERVQHINDKKTRKEQGVALEQAKSRIRVEVDIVLESNVCVQGGYIRGQIKIRIRKRSKKESPILLSEGKIRIVGYEMIPHGDERHIFYQCAAPLSSVTDAVHNVYCTQTDEDGFAQGLEGVHVLPFALHLPADGSFGSAKGTLNVASGVIVRYIAMVSIRVKDPDTGKRSIAHFYRDCEVWPVLNPSQVLQPASRLIQATANKSISLIGGGSAKVKLNAQIHRLYWPAGTRCPISIRVANGSRKTIRSLLLTLVRTTTIFRPRLTLDADGDRDPDSCQTVTAHKVTAEASLEMGAGVAKGHASAKGWWTGVSPGQELEFSHFIVFPPDALSVTRGRLLEVEYSIRVTLSAGSLASDIFVTLPVRIFNFISIDPPPSAGLLSSTGAYIRSTQLPTATPLESVDTGRRSTFGRTCSVRTTLPTTIEDEEPEPLTSLTSHASSLRVTNPDIPHPVPSIPSKAMAFKTTLSEDSIYSNSTSEGCMAEDDGDVDTSSTDLPYARSCTGTMDIEGDVGSDEELEAVLDSAKLGGSQFLAAGKRRDTSDSGYKRPTKTSLSAQAHAQGDLTPRMEGVGSGMRKAHERKILAARVARARSNSTGEYPPASVSSSNTSDSSLAEEVTPRVSHAVPGHMRAPRNHPSRASSGKRSRTESYSGSAASMSGGSSRSSKPSSRVHHDTRHLPKPPTYSKTIDPPTLSRLLKSGTAQRPGLRLLPVPPAIPATHRTSAPPSARSLSPADNRSLRKSINSIRSSRSSTRPISSPARSSSLSSSQHPHSPYRPHSDLGHKLRDSGTDSGTDVYSSNGGLTFRQKLAALEDSTSFHAI